MMQETTIASGQDIKVDTSHEPSASSKVILGALQSKRVYEGTVAPVVKQSRRAANKVAKASRKKNRK
jgi:hypothetical protein